MKRALYQINHARGCPSTPTLAVHSSQEKDRHKQRIAGILPAMTIAKPRAAAAPKVDLEILVTRQRGIVSRPQAFATGLDDGAIRRELRNGHWQRLLPGIYATFSGAVTLEQKRLAATLYAGRSAQITGVAALVWHGFRHLPSDQHLYLLVPHTTRRMSRGFVRIHRTLRLDSYARESNGYTVCSVARSVADACRYLDELRSAQAIVAEGVQRRLVTPEALHRELELAGSSRTRLLRRALRDIAVGVRSVPEIDFKNVLCRSTLLKRVLWNARITTDAGRPLPTPDGWIDEVGIALEVDSREYHLGPEEWQKTMRRHNTLTAHGILVLHFTPSEIRSRPAHVRQVVEQAYRERLAQGARGSARLASPLDQEGAPVTA
jgi:hypothetical protein